VVTVLEAIKSKISSPSKIFYALGCSTAGDETSGFAEAVKAAEKAEVIVAVVGESAPMSGEAASRTSLDLPGRQDEFLKALQKIGKPVVMILMGGRPLSISWAAENIPAIIEAWHPGIQGGNAIADVLFGDSNPSGKLAVTFPRAVGQVPIYYSHENTGRPAEKNKFTSKYIDAPATPLYPFGYGLSYTKFKYSNLTLSADKIPADSIITVSAEVENAGQYEGDEIVELYIQDEVASVIRPVKELKGFTKVHLKPGEKKTVTFTLEPKELGFYNQEMKYVVEPGVFKIWVAWNSAEGLEASFEVVKK
jgi:beta-glucosidase